MNGLHIIHASGDPYAFGRAIGEQVGPVFKAKILETQTFQDHLHRWRGRDHIQKLRLAAAASFPEFVQEIEGMADAAGIDFETLLIWNCRGDLAFTGDHPDGCTTVLLPGKNGHHTIAHNEDGPFDLLENGFWLIAKPEHGINFESFLYPGMLPGHTLGVNERGLVQTINNIQPHDLKAGVPRHFIARAVLDCETLKDALSVLKRDDRASGFHHSLMQTNDTRLLSVEAPASGCHIENITAPYVHTNHLIHPKFSDIPASVSPSSLARLERARELISQGMTTELLFDRAPGTLSLYRTADDKKLDDEFTLATGIFTLSSGSVDFQIITDRNDPAPYRNRI